MNRKGFSPIVTITLFLVLTIISTISIQTWFSSEQSNLIGTIEDKESLINDNIKILEVKNNEIYLKSRNKVNITKIQINENDCLIESEIIFGIENINISSCLGSISNNIVKLKIFTTNTIISKSIVVTNTLDSQSLVELLEVIGYNDVFAQWVGASGNDVIKNIITDDSGNIYLVGEVLNIISNDGFGTLNGTKSGSGSTTEGFLIKLNSSGEFIFGQWIGGSSDELITNVELDSNNNIIIFGTTTSTSFDDGFSSFDGTNDGSDSFMITLNPEGNFIEGSWLNFTLTKGVLDDEDNIYIIGSGEDSYLESEYGVFNGFYSGFGEDFILKLNSSKGFMFGHWFGGSGTEELNDIVLDSNQNVYLAGYATSIDDDVTGMGGVSSASTFQGVYLKLNTSGDFVQGHYFGSSAGGSSDTRFSSIAIDSNSNIIVGGNTRAGSFDDGLGSFTGIYDSGSVTREGFIIKFNSTGSFEFGQWIGANSEFDEVSDVFIDASDDIFVTGFSYESINDGLGSFNGTFDTNQAESYLVKFNNSGSYEFGHWFGGYLSGGFARTTDVLPYVDLEQNLYIYGRTSSSSFDDGLVTFNGTYDSYYEGFFIKFEPVLISS